MSNHRPRLLFLAFYFPPLRSVASLRAVNIAKHLSRAGWEVSVVTPDPKIWLSPDDPQRVGAELEQWGVHRIYTGHRWRCLASGFVRRSYPRGAGWFLDRIAGRISDILRIDSRAGWYPEVTRACAKLLPGDVDVVLATGNPFGLFRVASRIGKRLGCPYVLDYRDLWSGNPHSGGSNHDRHQDQERRLLQGCAAVSVVSPSMATYLCSRFGMAEKIHVLSNGYAPSDFDGIEPRVFGHFAIVYAGGFYPPIRSADPLMQALRRLAAIEPSRPWRFHYYGPHGDHIRESSEKHGVGRRVELHGVVPRRECLAAIRGAGVATIVVSVYDTGDLPDHGIITGKIFEPIGLGTPIVVIAPRGADVETLVETVGNGGVFTGSNVEGMAMFFADLMRGKGVESRRPETYSWPVLIQRFEEMLLQAIARERSPI